MINRWDNLKFDCYYKDELVASVAISGNRAYIKRLTNHPVKQIFYADEIDIFKLSEILKSRLWQENYAGIDRILAKMKLKYFDVLKMIKQTHGVSYNDFFWIKFEGEDVCWDDIKPKNRIV